jgi:hypothetical protein
VQGVHVAHEQKALSRRMRACLFQNYDKSPAEQYAERERAESQINASADASAARRGGAATSSRYKYFNQNHRARKIRSRPSNSAGHKS